MFTLNWQNNKLPQVETRQSHNWSRISITLRQVVVTSCYIAKDLGYGGNRDKTQEKKAGAKCVQSTSNMPLFYFFRDSIGVSWQTVH